MSEWLCLENGTRPKVPCCTACVPADMEPRGTLVGRWNEVCK